MKRFAKICAGVVVSVAVAAGALFVNVWYFKPSTIDAFDASAFARFALDRPELLSELRPLPPWLAFYGDKLDDASPEHDRAEAERFKSALAMLHRYDRNALDREGKLSYDVLDYYLRVRVDGDRYRLHAFPVNQLDGTQTALPDFMIQAHQVDTVDEADDYVKRLVAFSRQFDQLLESLKLRQSRGMIPPRFVVDAVIAQMEAFVTPPTRENPMFANLKARIDAIPAERADSATRARLLARAEAAIGTSVYPAYRKLIDYFIALRPLAQRNDGAWILPDGDQYYAWCARRATTTDLTPAALHEFGIAEVTRIGAAVDALLRAQGMAEGSVGQRLAALSRDRAQLFPNTPAGRKAMLDQLQSILDEANRGLGRAFEVRPKLGVEVRAVPEFAQSGTAVAYYSPGSIDGSRPGIFYANLRDTSAMPKFEMRNYAFHEGIPGHHFQISIAQELHGVPFFRKVIGFDAYSEGWALYAEQLAFELGLERDALDSVGRLRWEMLRAVRLVVDTGIHYKRWTREPSIAYMTNKTGKDEAFATAEVERYFVNPGQALAYEVGMEKMLALRGKAKAALGPKFDLAQFHNEVLIHGSLPLVVLERVIDDWIAKVQAA
ncbi:MAG TPA: DUF885 domain-containing protein [Casimicrobiaceae bacterium]|nr:DUF885 domain-containing protein [Casimicrobiaceae bacterium]